MDEKLPTLQREPRPQPSEPIEDEKSLAPMQDEDEPQRPETD